MRTKTLWSLLIATVLLGSTSCRVSDRRGFTLDLTDFEQSAAVLDDVMVWPVQQRGVRLSETLLQRMTDRLHRGVVRREYSALNRAMIDKIAEMQGPDESIAIQAAKQKRADGVLLLHLTKWDERGLLSLGKVRVEGELRLLSPEGSVLWQGRLVCDEVLVDGLGGPRNLEERREVAVERLADLVAARLPQHRV
ncbi:MAG: hypothetical protein H6832_08295 [Planctomycetes bacterium]|nr:hypothetical protein [Planctomycetota bacterium]MCB9918388.1 hypothetical protein [Planctomycetota bacterium]